LTPESIDDTEEKERVSQMTRRDSLVRGLGVVELVHRLLKSVHSNDLSSVVSSEPLITGAAGAATGALGERVNHVSRLML